MTRPNHSQPIGESPIEAQLAAPPVPYEPIPATGQTNATSNTSQKNSPEWISRPWVIVVLVLHVGCFGIPIYWKTNHSVGVRLAIIAVSIVYTVAAVAFIYVMLRWIANIFFGW